jgi:hypothetical protein
MGLTVGNPADYRTDHKYRDQHQWQNDNSHLPTDFQVVDKFEEVSGHKCINSFLESVEIMLFT